ncbi:MAG: thioredoxin family protein [Candidatus Hadarchaeum sp.]|uniref:thioredoxin family protein n=1 Tax=Candidatus Hadarchaeum sp. TaxID=2883567 RepID=UPI003176C667
MKVLVEVFASLPPCSGGRMVKKMMREISEKYGDRVEIKIYEGMNEKVKEYGIERTPAIVIDHDIRIIGLAPSMETLENALKEAGL